MTAFIDAVPKRLLAASLQATFLPRPKSIAVLLLAFAGALPVRLVAATAPAGPSAGASDQPKRLIFRPDINDFYPEPSRSQGEQGKVELRLCYDESGRVRESMLVTSSGFPRLDEAAVRMGRLYRYQPIVINGVPQPACVVQAVRFGEAPSSPAAAAP